MAKKTFSTPKWNSNNDNEGGVATLKSTNQATAGKKAVHSSKAVKNLFTSESVSEGHPDKVCDQVSDSILDAILEQDPQGRVACETLVTTGTVVVAGEITTNAHIDIPTIVRNTIREIGYTDAKMGFDYRTCGILQAVQKQSPDIAMGVDTGGAGDQGMMFGYATDETPELMPMPIMLAHHLVRELARFRKEGLITYLRPDAKSQVTIEYQNGEPVRVDTVVVSTQHDSEVSQKQIEKDVREKLVPKVISKKFLDAKTRILVNPTGRFEIGGPHGDTGLTGRKIIVDTYGGVGAHGGGAFSGKDPSKVDRSASYFARYAAKNIVASGLARRCEIQVAYAIGVAQPVSVMVNTFGTGKLNDTVLAEKIQNIFDFTPRGIITTLKLRRPVFRQTAAYGHFGRDEDGFTWEEIDRAKDLKKLL
ncbi:MAG: methionine adenosyltransferase [Candidatus Omnitrophica bacterium]|nr:methionine adenosyltransferase [Candidatus Omnitrophota bacterium]